jgi:hypothetical protein
MKGICLHVHFKQISFVDLHCLPDAQRANVYRKIAPVNLENAFFVLPTIAIMTE